MSSFLVYIRILIHKLSPANFWSLVLKTWAQDAPVYNLYY
uniref:Uncharacterized protein n=1 Tax=Arundo donax TaxID=35708 RepID=A0A0A8ZJA5_ARUDO